MKGFDSTRRDFLKAGGIAVGGTWLAWHWPVVAAAARNAAEAREAGAAFQVLSATAARELGAIASRIIPSDDGPGAAEAGVIHFFDAALDDFASPMLAPLQAGLADLETRVQSGFPGARDFAELEPGQQDELLRSIEDEPFFRLVRFLTLWGMFAMPTHGGNRDRVGWRLLGFEDRHAWQPPFGHYDAEASAPEVHDDD